MHTLRSTLLLLPGLCLIACSADSPMKSSAVSGAGGASGEVAAAAGTGSDDFMSAPPVTDAGTIDLDELEMEREPNADCSPGKYVGTYKCTLEMNGMMSLPLEGAVSFDLTSKQTTTEECDADQEFCDDLVIDEGSGKLLGFALLFIGFETSLEGGLDCKSGKFHAKAADGVWGLPVSSNPNDPNAPLTVSKPPSGTFDGEMNGVHLGGDPQKIEGNWLLHEVAMNLNCPGPFTVTRQP